MSLSYSNKMINKNKLEFVCSYNKERSTTAEAIAKECFSRANVSGLEARSSGTLVSDPSNFKPSRRLVEHAMQTEGIYDEREIAEIKTILERNDESALLPYHVKAKTYFDQKGINYVQKALGEAGIYRSLKRTPEQIVARPDVALVLTMDQKQKQKVQETYQSSGMNPKIATLAEYIERPGLEIKNVYAKSEIDYKEMVGQLVENVPEVVTRASCEVRR